MNSAGWEITISLKVPAARDEDLRALEAVHEHRAVHHSEEIFSDLESPRSERTDVIRPTADLKMDSVATIGERDPGFR